MIETAGHRVADVHSHAYPYTKKSLSVAIRRTLAYADLFDYPLSASEIHRYLHGMSVTLADVHTLLKDGLSGVEERDGFYVLAGRSWIVAERRRRTAISAPLIRRMERYARVLAYLPFVRMVALTGSLAMQNADRRGDIDLMVVTAPGRVWLGRAMVIILVHLARLVGDILCPNFVIAENAMDLGELSIYDAHEIAQMKPLCGHEMYRRLWASNPQVLLYLPNAHPWPMPPEQRHPIAHLSKRGIERLLGGHIGDWLEAWECRRKIDHLSRQQAMPSTEIVLSADQCKGHFDQHRARVLATYQQRITQLEGYEPLYRQHVELREASRR